ncbi:MAG: bifunctional 4-hydroxy-2-oxoglutarate aldolase/2-dehydro-3-deoxy-phosphogluconate aldolase, partial [Endozoicomonas sp.]
DDVEQALPLAETLIRNGMPIAEVTLRSDAALESIELISREFPEMLMIAGTVLNPEQADKAVRAGADMVVSPGFNPATVAHCVENNIAIIPGVVTPGEMEQAMMHGLNMVKFFPAEANGGVNFLKAVGAPYRNLQFMPTGGINPENIHSYLALKQVVCCGGSWMVKPELIREGRWEELGRLVKEAIELVNS